MATQRDVQQLIQGLTPSSINNGNPNTVYNTPVPTVDALGRWTSPTVNPAATLPPLDLAAIRAQLGGWSPPVGGGTGGIQGPILPTMPPGGGGGGGGGSPTPPPVTPPVVGPPVPVTDGRGNDYLDPRIFEPDRAGPITGAPPPATTTGGPGSAWGRPVYGPGVTGGGGGGGPGGGFDWRQALDGIANLIGIDPYMQGTGEWDVKGALGDLVDVVTGLPVNQAGSWLGGNDMLGDGFLSDYYFDQSLRDARDRMGLNQNEMQQNTNQSVRDNIDRILAELRGGSTPGGPSRPSSQAAGATTIAEGRAAQDMVGDMQLKSFLNRTAGQARAAMNPRYQYER